MQGSFAAPAATYFARGGKVGKTPPGDAAGANFVRHVGLPPDPRYGGRIPVKVSSISGAQNLSGFLRLHPGHWALGLQKLPLVRFHFCAWLGRAGVCVRCLRAGLGPAPTLKTGGFQICRRGGCSHLPVPNRVSFLGGPAGVRPIRKRRNASGFAVGAAISRPQAFPFRGRCRAKRGG